MSKDAPLPTDVATLQQLLLRERQVVASMAETISEQQRKLQQQEHRLAQLLRQMYGRRSERFHPDQLTLFDAAELTAIAEETTRPASAGAGKRRPKGHGRRPIPASIPRETITYELSTEERPCPCCGELRGEIGRERSEQLEYTGPVQGAGSRAREVCLPQVPGAGGGGRQAAAAGGQRLAGSRAVGPYGAGQVWRPCAPLSPGRRPRAAGHHLAAQHAVRLDRCGGRPGRTLVPADARARPGVSNHLDRRYDREVTGSSLGPGPRAVLGLPGRSPAAVHGVRLYRQPQSRRPGRSCRDCLLQADACGLRRTRAARSSGGLPAHSVAVAELAPAIRRPHQALSLIQRLYEVESDRRLGPAARRVRSVPLLAEFRDWLHAECASALPKSPIGQAATYARNQWQALTRYCEDGELSIDNNAGERAMKIPALGRKAWLFVASRAGGRRAAILYSLVASCKANQVEPWAYLRDIFSRLPSLANDSPELLDPLLPNRWLLDHPQHRWVIDDLRRKTRQPSARHGK